MKEPQDLRHRKVALIMCGNDASFMMKHGPIYKSAISMVLKNKNTKESVCPLDAQHQGLDHKYRNFELDQPMSYSSSQGMLTQLMYVIQDVTCYG